MKSTRFSEFIRNGSLEEKQKVYEKVIDDATEVHRKEIQDYWANLSWTCMVCDEERQDKFISVDSRQLMSPVGIEFTCNVRYCNDRPECKTGTKKHKLFELGTEIASGT